MLLKAKSRKSNVEVVVNLKDFTLENALSARNFIFTHYKNVRVVA